MTKKLIDMDGYPSFFKHMTVLLAQNNVCVCVFVYVCVCCPKLKIIGCNTTMNKHLVKPKSNQTTNGPVNAHLIFWPSKAQNMQNLENIW